MMQAAGVGLCLQLLSLAAVQKDRNEQSMGLIQAALVKSCQESGASLPLSTEASGATLDALETLKAEPVGGHFSRFFGQSEVFPGGHFSRFFGTFETSREDHFSAVSGQ